MQLLLFLDVVQSSLNCDNEFFWKINKEKNLKCHLMCDDYQWIPIHDFTMSFFSPLTLPHIFSSLSLWHFPSNANPTIAISIIISTVGSNILDFLFIIERESVSEETFQTKSTGLCSRFSGAKTKHLLMVMRRRRWTKGQQEGWLCVSVCVAWKVDHGQSEQQQTQQPHGGNC